MDSKVEQFDTPPPNYKLTEHATNGFSIKPSPAQIISYIMIAFSISVYFSCTNWIQSNTPLFILFIILTLTVIISSALATWVDPTDRVVYYYKWSRHDKTVSFSPQYDKMLFC
jgi:hypothetical protein